MTEAAPPRFLEAERATWEEARAFLQRFPAAILPLGATEQHGPHLPQSTDTLIAKAVSRGVAERVGGYLLPAVPVGYSWTWKNFAGTPWLRFETMMRLVEDVVESLERQGVRAMLVMTGHAANEPALKYAVRVLADRGCGVAVLYGGLWGIPEVVSEFEGRVWRGMYELHAEELETSLMLAIAPDLVRMDRAVAGYPVAPKEFGHSALSMGDIGASGVFGDATRASAEKGRRWLEVITARTAEAWREFLKSHGVPGKEG